MQVRLAAACCAGLLFCARWLPAATAAGEFDLPDGFEVSLYADDALAHDIFSMTIDARGRVVVSGPGYIKTLIDDDGDGQAESAQLFSANPTTGAQGMYFDGSDLIYAGGGTLARLRDQNGDGVADGPAEVWAKLRGGEHGAHAVLLGPDGCFYVVCGNEAGVTRNHITHPRSPVKQPRCGTILRLSRDGQRRDVFAHGFRNPYDADFSSTGNLLTVDSDGERDHHLPWYAPTRLFDVAQGQEHGWLAGGHTNSWSRPEAFFDNVARAAELGRGSPTGVVVYRQRQFPSRYQDGVFSADWTFGRIYFLPLTPRGATYVSTPETFIQSRGEDGFAPVDLAVGPAGDLFVAMGGRSTRGSVFRVRYRQPSPTATATDELARVLAADQPLESWSRAKWVPLARQLGREPFVKAIGDTARSLAERIRAVEVLTELFGGVELSAVDELGKQGPPELIARVLWSVARSGDSAEHQALLFTATGNDCPIVARAAWEGLMTMGVTTSPAADWRRAFASTDRSVRAAAIKTVAGWDANIRTTAFDPNGDAVSPRQRMSLERARGLSNIANPWRDTNLDDCLAAISAVREPNPNPADCELAREGLRLIQLALGDIEIERSEPGRTVGYVARHVADVPLEKRQHVAHELARRFPTSDATVNREMSRVLAMLEIDIPQVLDALSATWTDRTSSADDLHTLFVMSRLAGERSSEVARRTAHALVRLHYKLRAHGDFPSRTWPIRVGEAFEGLCRLDPALAALVIADPDFGLVEHTLFTETISLTLRQAAARRILANRGRETSDTAEFWSADLVKLVAALPDDEALPILREHWTDTGIRDAIALVLARRRKPEDCPRLLDALASLDDDVVTGCAEALCTMDCETTPDAVGAACRALARWCDVTQGKGKSGDRSWPYAAPRRALVALVERMSGKTFAMDEGGDPAIAYQPIQQWFQQAYPEQARAQSTTSQLDVEGWLTRTASLDWNSGDAAAGRRVFERHTCHRCHGEAGHGGNSRLGPDLAGAAERFSREDLLTAIVEPSRDVAPAYRTTAIETRSGKIHYGLVVYESPDGTLLQTAADTTIRIIGDDLLSLHASDRSLMPTGLLSEASDRDLVDLYAYLRSLKRPQ